MVAEVLSAVMRVAVTGARGRLGQPLIRHLTATGATVLPWSRPDYDLDDPSSATRVVERDRPDLIIHAAGWVDVDGCAKDPALAARRNAAAVEAIARAASTSGADLVLISTNEVFAGDRRDGRGYAEDDQPLPANAYGASKLEGERAAQRVMEGGSARLWILRTSWLYGPAGNDFPSKIVAAVDRGIQPLRVVDDEFGCPTSTVDLAAAAVDAARILAPGVYHACGPEAVSRFAWATGILAALRPEATAIPIGSAEFTRASTPPRWGVLRSVRLPEAAFHMRTWRQALEAQAASGTDVAS